MFRLDKRLEADTVEVCRLDLSCVRLMNDRRFVWVVLVPQREGIREICELAPGDRAELIEEIARVQRVLLKLWAPGKINVGALGNVVSQLHVHVVARGSGDEAWPGPVWGSGKARPYPAPEREGVAARLRKALGNGTEKSLRRREGKK